MPKDYPDHHDADLVLRLYELRRETIMRESRTVMSMWTPRTIADVLAIAQSDHPSNSAFRQVAAYWEMAFGMARHGVIHPEFLVENSGEGLYLFARIEPFLGPLREASSPRAFMNAEWVSRNTEYGREFMPRFRARIEQALAAK